MDGILDAFDDELIKLSEYTKPKNVVKARSSVYVRVRNGQLSKPSSRKCAGCGKPAAQYDHPNGHSTNGKVEPVCMKCHGRRSRMRGEHSKK